MFLSKESSSISITCRDVREEVIINGTGVLKVKDGCKIHTSIGILKSTVHFHKIKNIKSFSKNITFTMDEINITTSSDVKKIKILPLSNQNFNENIEDDDELDKMWEIKKHTISSASSIIIAVVITFLILAVRRCIKNRSSIGAKFDRMLKNLKIKKQEDNEDNIESTI